MPKENPGGVRSKKSKPPMEMQDLAANRSTAPSGGGLIPGGDAHGVQAPGDDGVGARDVPQREEPVAGAGGEHHGGESLYQILSVALSEWRKARSGRNTDSNREETGKERESQDAEGGEKGIGDGDAQVDGEEKKEGEGEAVERSRSAVGAEPLYDIPLDD